MLILLEVYMTRAQLQNVILPERNYYFLDYKLILASINFSKCSTFDINNCKYEYKI